MTRRILISIIMLLAVIPASGAFAAPDDTQTLAPGDTYEFTASLPAGLNPNYFPWAEQAEPVFPIGQCSKNPNYYCDTFLFNFTNPMTQEQIDSGLTFIRRTATVQVGDYPFPGADFDLRAFDSDPEGTKGMMIGESGNAPGEAELIALSLRSTPEKGEHWVLVEVAYWAGIGGYSGSVRF
jgi:hypothetical protein